MLYPPVAELLTKVESRYLLVNLVAHRARQIAAEAEEFHEDLPEKPVTMAIQEVAEQAPQPLHFSRLISIILRIITNSSCFLGETLNKSSGADCGLSPIPPELS